MANPAITRMSQASDGNILSTLRPSPAPASSGASEFSTLLDQRVRNNELPPAPERPASRPARDTERSQPPRPADRTDNGRLQETTNRSGSTPAPANRGPDRASDPAAKTAASDATDTADAQETADTADASEAQDSADAAAVPATLAAIASIIAALDRSSRQPDGDVDADAGLDGDVADPLLKKHRGNSRGFALAPQPDPTAASSRPAAPATNAGSLGGGAADAAPAAAAKPAKVETSGQASFAAAQAPGGHPATPPASAPPGVAADLAAGGGLPTAAGTSAALRAESGAPTQLQVHTPAGQRIWAEDVGSRLLWMVGRGESKAELMLTPPSLGKLAVSIQVNGDQTTAQFVAATSAARDALEQAMPRLREVLQQAGINLGQTNVSTSSDHQARDDTGGRGSPRGGHAERESPSGADGVAPAQTANWSRVGSGVIDTFA